jgi:hypothetical protein
MMTLWYFLSTYFFESLPMFALHDFQHTACQPFVTSIDKAYRAMGTLVYCAYPIIGFGYFIYYWKISKPKWLCWCFHMLIWFVLIMLPTYQALWMLDD